MKRTKLLLALSALMIIASCTVEKRRYTDGYHVEWNRNKGKAQNAVSGTTGESLAVNENSALADEATLPKEVNTTESQAVPAPVAVAQDSKAMPEVKTKSPLKALKKSADADVKYTANKNLFKNFYRGSVQTLNASPLEQSSQPDMVVLILLAIFIPPLAVYLYEGTWNNRCWLNLILTLLCGLPGMIHALIVVLE